MTIFLFIFRRYIAKHLMSVPSGNSFVFPRNSMSHVNVNIESLGKTKLFPSRADIKCILYAIILQCILKTGMIYHFNFSLVLANKCSFPNWNCFVLI